MNAKKDRLGADDALALAQAVNVIHSMRGTRVTTLNLRTDSVNDELLKKLMVGPTGNLRAPVLRKGKTLVVGFNEQVYQDLFG